MFFNVEKPDDKTLVIKKPFWADWIGIAFFVVMLLFSGVSIAIPWLIAVAFVLFAFILIRRPVSTCIFDKERGLFTIKRSNFFGFRQNTFTQKIEKVQVKVFIIVDEDYGHNYHLVLQYINKFGLTKDLKLGLSEKRGAKTTARFFQTKIIVNNK